MPFNLDKRVGRGPVCLTFGAGGSWESDGVYGPGPVIKFGPGDYRMWYEGINVAGTVQTGYATSPNGMTWTKYGSNPVLVPVADPNWENNEASLCGIVYNPGGSPAYFEAWFHGGNNSGGSGGGRAIGYATSADGITWSKYVSNPVMVKGTSGAFDDNWVADAKVIKLGATDYRMWYGGRHTADTKRQIGYATSTDGKAWTKSGSNPIFSKASGWESNDISAFCPILISPGNWHAWYIATDVSVNGAMGHATSPDGIVWTRSALNPVMSYINATSDQPIGSIHVYQDVDPLVRIMRGSYTATGTLRQKAADTLRPSTLP